MFLESRRLALVVRGGWDGHHPVEATESFMPFLKRQGFKVLVEQGSAIYADVERMAGFDVIIQCVTMSEITNEQVSGLRDTVAAGTGFVGWHGGITDSYRNSAAYLQLVGGQFVDHPSLRSESRADGQQETVHIPHTIEFTAQGRTHPVTAGMDGFELTTEQYWVLTDDLNDVLATTTHAASPWHPWSREVTVPTIWTRSWGLGNVFVTTPGHDLSVLTHPSVRTIIERSVLWASRATPLAIRAE